MIQYINAENYKNLYVVGDLHGCYTLLMNELEKKDFDFTQDLLICTGDLIDKGPENEKCISLLDENWFCTVRGNHEEICIDSILNPSLQNLHRLNGGEWFFKLKSQRKLAIVEQLKQLPLAIEIRFPHKKIGVVHADIDLGDWELFKTDLKKGNYNITGIKSSYYNAMWGRGRIKQQSDLYTHVKNITEIYHGHTIVQEPTKLNNCIYIDTGAFFTQKLCILKIN